VPESLLRTMHRSTSVPAGEWMRGGCGCALDRKRRLKGVEAWALECVLVNALVIVVAQAGGEVLLKKSHMSALDLV
jgi:hypothetical protein